jgi:hypothetical protein
VRVENRADINDGMLVPLLITDREVFFLVGSEKQGVEGERERKGREKRNEREGGTQKQQGKCKEKE